MFSTFPPTPVLTLAVGLVVAPLAVVEGPVRPCEPTCRIRSRRVFGISPYRFLRRAPPSCFPFIPLQYVMVVMATDKDNINILHRPGKQVLVFAKQATVPREPRTL